MTVGRTHTGVVLVGREGERAQLRRLLADLRLGHGSGLLVRGEAGIGKTALLSDLVRSCGAEVTVLHTAGVQAETDLAFAALSDLLTPVLDDVHRLPGPQAAALASALALGPPRPGDRLAVCVATAALLGAGSGRGPRLVVVDDVQWLDAASRECVRFAARRAAGRVAFVLAERRSDPAGRVAADRDDDNLPTLRLGPVDQVSARSLLARTAPDLVGPVAELLVAAAAGNPLALTELPATLSAAQRTGRAPVGQPLAVGAQVHGIYARRIAQLDRRAQQVLRLVAVDGECGLGSLTTACTAAATDVDGLDRAEAAGLLRVRDGRVGFGHPLVRSVVWWDATSGERRAAHRALAGVSSGEARAWHLAAAATGPDEQVAAELERAAGTAAARRGYASATRALRRSAELSPGAADRVRRTLAAGGTAVAAGLSGDALELFTRVAECTTDPSQRARAEHLRGLTLLWRGDAASAAAVFLEEADRLATEDPPAAAPVLADAANACAVLGRVRDSLALAERAAAALGGGADPAVRAHVLAVLGWGLVMRGQGQRARAVLAEAEELAGALDPLSPAGAPQLMAVNLRLPTGDFERALATSRAMADRARAAGALGALTLPLIVAADAAYRLGDWTTCDAVVDEAVQTAQETGLQLHLAHALVVRARLSAARGTGDAGRDAAARSLAVSEGLGVDSGRCYAHACLGFDALGRERVPEAIGHLAQAAAIAEAGGLAEPTLVPWAGDLVEAYARAGRTADADRVLTVLAQQADGADTAVARALHARCAGLVADDHEPAFRRALAFDDLRPMPFERARTQLAFGRRLHRGRHRAQARVQLHAALAGFEQLGATPWAVQARNELHAAGGRQHRAPTGTLTAQESRVAAAAARGGSNRDIATELCLSPKTVEFHLGQIYRKLGVRRRTQMVAALAATQQRDPARVGPALRGADGPDQPNSAVRHGQGRGSGSGRQSVPSGDER